MDGVEYPKSGFLLDSNQGTLLQGGTPNRATETSPCPGCIFPPVPKESFTHQSIANVPKDQVWKALDTPQTWESIGGVDRIFDPLVEDGTLRGFSFETTIGGMRYRGTATPRERVEGETMSWNISSPDIRGYTSVTLADHESATTSVSVTVEVEAVGFLASMVFPAIAKTVGGGLPSAVEDFVRGLG